MSHAALLEAIRAGNTQAASDLLAGDRTLCALDDDPSALMLALYHRQPDIAGIIGSRRQYLTIFEAAALGATGSVQNTVTALPVAAKAFSDDGFTALHLACFFGHAESAGLLLAAGADCNALATNGSLLRPLHSAATFGSVELCRLLLEAGADPNALQQSGFSALHAAALRGNIELAMLLLEHGARLDITAEDGRTASMIAIDSGHPDFADALQKM